MLIIKKSFKKEILYLLIISLISINISYWYTPSNKENKQLETIKLDIDNIYNNKGINNIVKLKEDINWLIEKNRKNEKKLYLLKETKKILVSYIEKDKLKNQTNSKNEVDENNDTNNRKKSFYNKYWNSILWDISEACIKNYDFIDNVAKEQNFPTALIIAFWKKEHNCYLDNPANWWWAFQITSAYYKPWEITLDEFKKEIIDFINFAKNKISYYEKDYWKFKAYFWNEDINLTYYEYNIRDIRLLSLLYNWIRKTTNLETFEFANWNLNSSIKTNSDWIVTTFLKVLKRELK